MKSMKKENIRKLQDKDLQLRYILKGLKFLNEGGGACSCTYWKCNINCSMTAVPDDENLKKVKEFIDKHNITNERFAKLTYNHITGAVMKYKDSTTPLFEELESVIKPYKIRHTNQNQIEDIGYKEKELVDQMYLNNGGIIWDFIHKYNITKEDFIALAKTYINDNIHGLCLANPEDKFIEDLKDVVDSLNLGVSKKNLDAYRNAYHESKHNTELLVNTKESQKKYLQFMKELLEKEPNVAIELLLDGLEKLGFDSKKDIKRLVKGK